eukprot:6408158-Amphidinium_carterae.7
MYRCYEDKLAVSRTSLEHVLQASSYEWLRSPLYQRSSERTMLPTDEVHTKSLQRELLLEDERFTEDTEAHQSEIEEADPKDDEILELFAIVKEDSVNEWIQNGTLPSHNIADHNDVRQGNFNFHTRLECTVNEYLNNCGKNDPREVPSQKEQFEYPYTYSSYDYDYDCDCDYDCDYDYHYDYDYDYDYDNDYNNDYDYDYYYHHLQYEEFEQEERHVSYTTYI